MVNVLAPDNLGEVEVGGADCASSDCLKIFCGFLTKLAGQRDTRDFLSCFLDI
jgi:hypothetical protein